MYAGNQGTPCNSIHIPPPHLRSGKTSYMMDAVALALLPVKFNNTHIGGGERWVLWVDVDLKFDIMGIQRRLLAHLERLGLKQHGIFIYRILLKVTFDTTADSIMRECLDRLRVTRPMTLLQFGATLKFAMVRLFGSFHSSSNLLVYITTIPRIISN